MFNHHPKNTVSCIRYFYLAANTTRHPEIIQVINSGGAAVQVPMREEDVELTAFFERGLTVNERLAYGYTETWKVFSSWDELEQDHTNFGVANEVLLVLLSLRYRFALEGELAISA